MYQNFSWEAISSSSSQEIPHILYIIYIYA